MLTKIIAVSCCSILSLLTTGYSYAAGPQQQNNMPMNNSHPAARAAFHPAVNRPAVSRPVFNRPQVVHAQPNMHPVFHHNAGNTAQQNHPVNNHPANNHYRNNYYNNGSSAYYGYPGYFDSSYYYSAPIDDENDSDEGDWVDASDGDVPSNAFPYQDPNGTTVYYCRAMSGDDMYYGELIPGDGCYIDIQSAAVRVNTYEVQIQTSD